MKEWSIELRYGIENAALDVTDEAVLDCFSDLGEAVTAYAGAVSIGPDQFSVRVALEGVTATDVIMTAEHFVGLAIKEAGAPDWPLIHVDATEWTAFERELEEPVIPELVGVSEIAAILEVSRQRASELARSEQFPAPIAQLSSGPIWTEPSIRRFVDAWERKPGRPRKLTDEEALEAVGALDPPDRIDLMEALKESVREERDRKRNGIIDAGGGDIPKAAG